jgi:aspartate 1-decarboxylase
MKRTMMHGKIHRVRVTGAFLDYEGSIALDPDLYEAAGFLPYEQVHVLDVDNGNRFVTYVIEGERGSGEVAVNGAAARLVQVGDTLIVLAYTEMDDEEARGLRPRVVLVDSSNRPVTAAVPARPGERAEVAGSAGAAEAGGPH